MTTTRTLAVVSAGLSVPSSTAWTVPSWRPPAAATRLAWVGASGTCAGLSAANSLRSTGTTSPPRMSSCSRTVLSGSPAWSTRNSWR